MSVKDFFQSLGFKWLLGILVGIIVVIMVFRAGMIIGYDQAIYSLRWRDNYPRIFGGPRMMYPGFPGDGHLNPHGIAGEVIKIDGSTIVLKGDDNIERTVVVSTSTVIRMDTHNASVTDIKNGTDLVAIGVPDQSGQIDAKFIRIFSQD